MNKEWDSMNAKEIMEKKFEKSAFGYRVDEVDDYLQEMATAIDKMQAEKAQLEHKLEILADKIQEYRADEDSMRAAILDARKLGASIVKDAQTQADGILADANTQAAKVIDGIQIRAEKEKMTLSQLQKEVATFKNQLLALYKNHLELISALPENSAEEAPVQEVEEPAAIEEPAAEPEQFAEELEEEIVPETEEIPAVEERESKFGQLRFGAGYDLKRDR